MEGSPKTCMGMALFIPLTHLTCNSTTGRLSLVLIHPTMTETTYLLLRHYRINHRIVLSKAYEDRIMST